MRLLLLICLGFAMQATAQTQSNFLGNSLPFKDGIYLSYDDFIQNKPSISLDKVKVKEKETRYFNKMKIHKIQILDEGKWQKMNLAEVWGICIDGMPHIQYMSRNNRNLLFGKVAKEPRFTGNFTRIRIIGSICHFHIEDYLSNNSNNYLNNQYSSFKDGFHVSTSKIMKLESGVICDFNEFNLGLLIQDDQKLFDHFKQDEQKEQRIFLYLQKYNERNPAIYASN